MNSQAHPPAARSAVAATQTGVGLTSIPAAPAAGDLPPLSRVPLGPGGPGPRRCRQRGPVGGGGEGAWLCPQDVTSLRPPPRRGKVTPWTLPSLGDTAGLLGQGLSQASLRREDLLGARRERRAGSRVLAITSNSLHRPRLPVMGMLGDILSPGIQAWSPPTWCPLGWDSLRQAA